MSKREEPDKLLRNIVDRALGFRKTRPWDAVSSDDPFIVRSPSFEGPLVCFILGSFGREIGFAALHGETVLAEIEERVKSGLMWSPTARHLALIMTFEPLNLLDHRFARLVTGSGIRFGANQAVPRFAALDPAEGPRVMTRTHLRMFLTALDTTLHAQSSGVLNVRPVDSKRRLLEIELGGKGKKASVSERVVTLPLAVPLDPTESVWDFDEHQLEDTFGHTWAGGGTSRVVEPEFAPFVAWKTADTELSKMLSEATEHVRGSEGETALHEYFGGRQGAQRMFAAPDADQQFGAFIDWYLMVYEGAAGTTVAQRMSQAGRLTPLMQNLLEARMKAGVAPYRVVAVDPGASLLVENTLSGERRTLHDLSLSKVASPGLLLVLRLYPAGEWNFCTLAGPAVGELHAGHLMSKLEDEGIRFGSDRIVGGQERMGRIFSMLAIAPHVTNTDGEDIDLLLLSFHVADPGRLPDRLAELPGVFDDGDGEWSWLEKRPIDPPDSDGIRIARIELFGEEILVHVNSKERARRVRQRLESIHGVTFLEEVAEPAGERGTRGPEPGMDAESAQEVAEHIRGLMLGWLDTAVPALDGLTPRAAYERPQWRAKVIQMIRTYPDSRGPNGVIPAPREEMLAQLGYSKDSQ